MVNSLIKNLILDIISNIELRNGPLSLALYVGNTKIKNIIGRKTYI